MCDLVSYFLETMNYQHCLFSRSENFKIGYLLVFSDRMSNMKGDVYYVTNAEQRKMNPLRNSNL